PDRYAQVEHRNTARAPDRRRLGNGLKCFLNSDFSGFKDTRRELRSRRRNENSAPPPHCHRRREEFPFFRIVPNDPVADRFLHLISEGWFNRGGAAAFCVEVSSAIRPEISANFHPLRSLGCRKGARAAARGPLGNEWRHRANSRPH